MFALARMTGVRSLAAARLRAPVTLRAGAPVAQLRGFAGAAATKVVKTLSAEIKHEEEQYEKPKEIKAFLDKSQFKLVETDGDVNMTLTREVGDKTVKIEWQLTTPFNPDMDVEGEEAQEQESTDFTVSVEGKSGAGLTFYCSTMTGEDHRYVIGNLKAFESTEERDSVSSYNGPEFEDVDDKLQEALDEYLAEIGVDTEICDFIDGSSSDKEQREYIRWLKTSMKFLDA